MRILESFFKKCVKSNQIITTFNFIFIGFLINLLQGKLKFINTLFIYFLIPFFNFLVLLKNLLNLVYLFIIIFFKKTSLIYKRKREEKIKSL